MFKLLLVSLTLVLALSVRLSWAQIENGAVAECRIYSDLYKQYLYAQFKFLGLGSRRFIYLWREKAYGVFYTSPKTQFNDKDKSGVWLFEPVAGRANTFFLRNKKHMDDYLRGSEKYQELIFKKNRAVFGEKLKNQVDDESFMWRIERVPNTHLYHIWNVKFNLPMYSREYYALSTSERQPKQTLMLVSLSQDQPDSEQFDWLFRCRDNILPPID